MLEAGPKVRLLIYPAFMTVTEAAVTSHIHIININAVETHTDVGNVKTG